MDARSVTDAGCYSVGGRWGRVIPSSSRTTSLRFPSPQSHTMSSCDHLAADQRGSTRHPKTTRSFQLARPAACGLSTASGNGFPTVARSARRSFSRWSTSGASRRTVSSTDALKSRLRTWGGADIADKARRWTGIGAFSHSLACLHVWDINAKMGTDALTTERRCTRTETVTSPLCANSRAASGGCQTRRAGSPPSSHPKRVLSKVRARTEARRDGFCPALVRPSGLV